MNDSVISLDSIKGSTKGFFRQKKSKNKDKRNSSFLESDSAPVELSIDEASPGLLKIFGCKIKSSQMYKAVLASPTSAAKELVKEALDRYNLPKRSFRDYVLCDVLGVLEKAPPEEHQSGAEIFGEFKWTERGVRALGDYEMPLTIQQLWKPVDGMSRRFELRLRADVSKPQSRDTQTRKMNRNARRIQMSRAKLGGIAEENDDSPESPDDNLTPTSSFSNGSGSRNSSQHHSGGSSEKIETESSEEVPEKRTVAQPTDCPFLLLLRGYNLRDDSVIYYINEQITQIGSSEFQASTNNINEKTEILLNSPDVKAQHCWILKKTKSIDRVHGSAQRLNNPSDGIMVNIHPILGAMIYLNGSPITKPTELRTGDILAIGQHYLFLYKDLTSFKELPRDIPWLRNLAGEPQASNLVPSSIERKELECSISGIPCLNYQKKDEDELLDHILKIVDPQDETSYKLTPCYLVGCMLDFCTDVYGKGECKKLVYKSIVAFNDYSREVCDKLNGYEHAENKAVLKCVYELCHLLRPVAFIMANSLEFLNCLETRKNLFGPVKVDQYATTKDKVMLQTTEDQLFAMLEDAVLQTFQQSVYQITKALSFILPALLHSNPFPNSVESPNRMPTGIQSVLDLFQGTLDTFSLMMVHPAVVEQLFGCLLFFTNSFLFNQLMDKGSTGNYFKWARGAQIRGNLDALESWLYQNSLQHIANESLGQLNAAVDLLAMLKSQLLRSDWAKLRHNFPRLSPAQLHFILSHYHLENASTPQAWVPQYEERLMAESEPFYESMDGAPPLEFPLEGFLIRKDLEVPDVSVYDYFTQIQSKFPPNPNTKTVRKSVGSVRGSWRQKRNRNTPSVTRMFKSNSPTTYASSQDVQRFDFNYIMGNASLTNSARHKTAEGPPLEVRARHQYESSSEAIMRSSGTLKNGEQLQMKSRESSIVAQNSHQNCQAALQGDLVLGSGSSGTFSGDSQSSILRGGPVQVSSRSKRSDGENSTLPRVRPVPQKDYSSRAPVITRVTVNSASPQSQHATTRAVASNKEHADDSSIANEISPRPVTEAAALVEPASASDSLLRPSSSSAFIVMNNQIPPNRPTQVDDNWANKTFHAIDLAETQSIDGMTISEDREIAYYMENPPEFITDDEFSESADTATIQEDSTFPDDISDCPTGIFDEEEDAEYLLMVELEKDERNGLGIGLIDGLATSLKEKGVYIRTILVDGAAYRDGRIAVGDRIMSVNNVNVSSMEYQDAMHVIRHTDRRHVSLVIAKCTSHFSFNSSASLC